MCLASSRIAASGQAEPAHGLDCPSPNLSSGQGLTLSLSCMTVRVTCREDDGVLALTFQPSPPTLTFQPGDFKMDLETL